MDGQSVGEQWYRVLALRDELYKLSITMIGDTSAFEDVSLRLPRDTPYELAFYQTVSWLYVLYMETGRVSLQFIMEHFPTYRLDVEKIQVRHYELIRKLRTYLQHNLNLSSTTDFQTQRTCEEWFSVHCGSSVPSQDKDWHYCVIAILRGSAAFLEKTIVCVREMEKDESKGMIVGQWSARISRYHPKYEFDRIAAQVAHDIGQDWIDVPQFVERHYDKWSRDLQSRSEDYGFEVEARRLIERTLLSDNDPPLPISGTDVMNIFGIPPGPEVGRMLSRAKAIYLANPSDGEQLIASLKRLLRASQ